MSNSPISYTPRPEATQEAEISALAAAYRFVLDTAMKEGFRPGAPDAAKGDPMRSAPKQLYNEPPELRWNPRLHPAKGRSA